ncbi:MAG: FGGY family carbohydrate kinase [Bacteroidetes bacterium]|nr:FGGY family carbohydrate kinase [Bacteroidota bacterium]
MKKGCCLVFDVGKTNQKFFLFDPDYQILEREKVTLPKTVDEEGHPAENISAIVKWMKQSFEKLLQADGFEIDKVSFSGFGATFVHLDENGEVVTPVYDYHKAVADDTFFEFYQKYGPQTTFSSQTGSKNLNLLNSGKQLYWLKQKRPELFQKIRHSLHLPQYLSYVFTGEYFTEYTSIGCHTDLWDYGKKAYHTWVKAEGIDPLFPDLVPTQTKVVKQYAGREISFGIGIHDSSSALLTYLLKGKESFLLLSTGTWCINFNPFSNDALFGENHIAEGATAYMKIDGTPVKSSRLFLGEEHRLKVEQLIEHFNQPKNHHHQLEVDELLLEKVSQDSKNYFCWKYLDNSDAPPKQEIDFANFETAYYQLIKELINLLKTQINLICENLPRKIYVDGGFSDNKIFLTFLKKEFPNQKIKAKSASFACALGAAQLMDL